MSWNGSGVFTRTSGSDTGASIWQTEAAAGQKISSAREDIHDQDLANGIQACLCKNGENSPSADLPMGAHKHTGCGNATATNQYLTLGQDQGGAHLYAVTSGTADAFTLTLSPSIGSYTDGLRIRFAAHTAANAGATLNVNSKGAATITSCLTADSLKGGGEITTSGVYEAVYKGGSWWLLNPSSLWTNYSPTKTGWSSFTAQFTRYILKGKDCTLCFNLLGTHNSTTTRITLPFTAASVTDAIWTAQITAGDGGFACDGGPWMQIVSGASVADFYKDAAGNAFNLAGAKIVKGTITYEIA